MPRVHVDPATRSPWRTLSLLGLLFVLPLGLLLQCVASGYSDDHLAGQTGPYGMCRVEDDIDLETLLSGRHSARQDCVASGESGAAALKIAKAPGRGARVGGALAGARHGGTRIARRSHAHAAASAPRVAANVDALPSVDAGPNWGGSHRDAKLWPSAHNGPRVFSQTDGGGGAGWFLLLTDDDDHHHGGPPPIDADPPGGAAPVPEPSARLLFVAGLGLIARQLVVGARRGVARRAPAADAAERG